MTNARNTVLYTGMTNNLSRRDFEHKERAADSFTKQYKVNKLVYAEEFQDVKEAIHREKCIKKWNRAWKIELIEKANTAWADLFELEATGSPLSRG